MMSATIITNYLHRGIPGPNGRCRSCGEQVTTGVANQGQLVDISGYGYCNEMSPLQRLQIDLEHAQDRVRVIERQIARLQAHVTLPE